MYEMLVGYPPFYSEEPMSTCRKVGMLCGSKLGSPTCLSASRTSRQNVGCHPECMFFLSTPSSPIISVTLKQKKNESVEL